MGNRRVRMPTLQAHQGENRGRPEAEDVPQQYPAPSFAVEDGCYQARHLCQPGLR